MKVTLNCENLVKREQAHAYLQEALNLPEYYGRNLDALYDCLTEMSGCTIALRGASWLRRADGYGVWILRTLEDAARENPGLEIVEEEEA